MLYMGIHKFNELSDERMAELWGKYKEQTAALGARAVRLHYNPEKKAAYCFTEADSKESVMKAHAGLSIPAEIIEIKTLN